MNDPTIIKQQPLLIQSIFRQQIKSHLVPQPLFVRRDSNGILTFYENLNGELGGPWLCFLTKISKGGIPAALISSCSSEQCPTTVRAGLFLLVTLSLIAYHGVPAPFDPLAKFPVGTSCDTNNNNNKAIIIEIFTVFQPFFLGFSPISCLKTTFLWFLVILCQVNTKIQMFSHFEQSLKM